MKKKRGYSLAEAMVALSIVGFIALLVMPILKGKLQDASNISKLQKVYKSLTDAVGNWMVDDRISEIRKTSYISAYPERFMPKYLRTMQESNTSTDGLLGKVYTDRNSHQFRIDFQDKYDCALLQNGSTLCLTPYNDDKYITRYGDSDVERIINHTINVKHYDNAISSIVKDEDDCYFRALGLDAYKNDRRPGCGTFVHTNRKAYEACSVLLSHGMSYDETLNLLHKFQNTISKQSIETFNNSLRRGLNLDSGIIMEPHFLYEMLNTAKKDENVRGLLTKNSAFRQLYDRYESDGVENFGLTCSSNPYVELFSEHGPFSYIKYPNFNISACNAQELYDFYQSSEFEQYYMDRYDNIRNSASLSDTSYISFFTYAEQQGLDYLRTNVIEPCINGNTDYRYAYDDGRIHMRNIELYNNFDFDTYSYYLSNDYEDNVVEENKSWDEVIERKPTYVAPSESGKVNISQEQVHAHSSDKPIMEVVVDTNGASKPNKLGTDLFIFYIYPDGHVGVRSQDTSTNNCYMNQYYQCFKAVFNNDWKKPY